MKSAQMVVAGDVDGDGDIDIIIAHDKTAGFIESGVRWFENLGEPVSSWAAPNALTGYFTEHVIFQQVRLRVVRVVVRVGVMVRVRVRVEARPRAGGHFSTPDSDNPSLVPYLTPIPSPYRLARERAQSWPSTLTKVRGLVLLYCPFYFCCYYCYFLKCY